MTGRTGRLIDLGWGLFALWMMLLMIVFPEHQTLPYHLIFVSLTVLYGFRMWSGRVSIAVLVTVTVLTGAIFAVAVAADTVALDEMAEIPLMPLIVGGMIWHAQRADSARRRVEELAALEGTRLRRQSQFLRETSHAIRTPVTIARGHVELLQMTSGVPQTRADADEVLHQLDRLSELAGRLLAIENLAAGVGLDKAPLDVRDFVATLGRRWRATANRRWHLSGADARSGAGRVLVAADERRLEEAVDALMENAVRFTGAGDVIRLSCRVDGGSAVIEVADSGPGIEPADRERVFQRFFHRHAAGEEPGTGLGLALVDAVAAAHGGRVVAGQAPEGGALLVLSLPLLPAAVAAPGSSPLMPAPALSPTGTA